VQRQARDHVKGVRYHGASAARPAPGVLAAIRSAEVVVICPSNPVASIDPILAVPGVRDALQARRDRVAAVSPIVGGAPLRGMADRLLPVVGVEVSAPGVAGHYADVVGAFVMDRVDAALARRAEEALGGGRVAVTDTIMVDDDDAHRLAQVALAVASGTPGGAGALG
jgi:LPPG:FO 2-phospho-L-lactate transferase